MTKAMSKRRLESVEYPNLSYYTLEPNSHDLNTALAILDMKKSYPGISLVAADGGFPFEDLIVEDTPVILGYKPDAICSDDHSVKLIEIKSFEDLFSVHSKKQYARISKVLASIDSVDLEIYVFGEGLLPSPVLLNLPVDSYTVRRFHAGAILEY
jgi:hypothetical protein